MYMKEEYALTYCVEASIRVLNDCGCSDTSKGAFSGPYTYVFVKVDGGACPYCMGNFLIHKHPNSQ